ncbi:biotin--[acetyl-CoA-carboxylase] ligase [Legionella impletisoli]|uniref:Bifunctional ligase/repressor BirA n=1 Tax=Legionella impletisoli TaxID=343510 RepID=A0A917JPF7_9GAMM|nr:biotin--[acetyl-CoA-carboxylase] ligase [Legionella impletisoli]GGI80169.1 bifunctional ligase/repressor BirA [Legionella impletisoli]
MIQFNQTQQKIIHYLSSGNRFSGTEIGKAIGISRTAVWKHIKQLIEIGVPIQSLPKQGYHLREPLILLDEKKIRSFLESLSFDVPITFHLFASLDSTNRYLKKLTPSTQIELCCAETQTQGRGRFNRHWFSPFGENVYCSFRKQFAGSLSQLSGLSLVVSLALRKAIQSLFLIENIHVKWPNDIIWQNKKLSGILIEIQAESHGFCDVIIGIGINVNAMTTDPGYESSWGSLREITGQLIDRNRLIANLIKYLNDYLSRFLNHGLQAFQKEWSEVDCLFNESITVSHIHQELHGTAQGINEFGQLRVVDQQGKVHLIAFGDTSLKRERK